MDPTTVKRLCETIDAISNMGGKERRQAISHLKGQAAQLMQKMNDSKVEEAQLKNAYDLLNKHYGDFINLDKQAKRQGDTVFKSFNSPPPPATNFEKAIGRYGSNRNQNNSPSSKVRFHRDFKR